MFTAQLAETRAQLGGRLALYQVHSLTPDSGLLDDPALLAALGRLRADGVLIGLTTSGPGQAGTLRRALRVTVDGQPLFAAAQVTWNLLEPSVASAAAEAAAGGCTILIKEALANGRLAAGRIAAGSAAAAGGAAAAGVPAGLAALAAARGVGPDAIAIAAALANPWASVVLSGAVTTRQLQSNLAALSAGDAGDLDLAEPPEAYWASRAGRRWQ
jgi:aryl-alcohol dehydrogenase-like predicted oxidoreductase